MTSTSIHALEQDLVRGLLAREHQAWRTFLARYRSVIYAAIDRVLRRFPELHRQTEREECYSLLLSSLVAYDMKKLRAYDAERGSRFSTWVSMLASNAAWDHLRRLPRRRPTTWDEALHGESAAHQSDPLAVLMAKEDVRHIEAALHDLTVRDRRFAELFYLSTLAAEEVADIMEISVKTVYTKNHKLRARLAHVLQRRRIPRSRTAVATMAPRSLRAPPVL